MTLLNVYLILSAALITIAAACWRNTGTTNNLIRLIMFGGALFGAVMIAKFVVNV